MSQINNSVWQAEACLFLADPCLTEQYLLLNIQNTKEKKKVGLKGSFEDVIWDP